MVILQLGGVYQSYCEEGSGSSLDNVKITAGGAVLDVGTAAAECRDSLLENDRYILPVSVNGLSNTPLLGFEFTLQHSTSILGVATEVQVATALSNHWLVTAEPTLEGTHLKFRTKAAIASAIPDGELVLVTFEVAPGGGRELVPVLVGNFASSPTQIQVSVDPGLVNVGVQKDTRVRLGSTSVMPGQIATVPVNVEGLCRFSTEGPELPRFFFDVTLQYDGAGLQFDTASREGTVVPPSWEFLPSPSGSNPVLLSAKDPARLTRLSDGTIGYLKFTTQPTTPLGAYAVNIAHAEFDGSAVVVAGEPPHALVEVKERVCVRPDEVLIDWDQFKAEVIGTPPLTRNRDCVAGHFARFSLFSDRLEKRTKLLMTHPLNHDDLRTMTAEAFRKIIAPPQPDRTCVNNIILMTGWVSYADWLPIVDPRSTATGERFLFTTRNFPDKTIPTKDLGRVEESTELLDPNDHKRLVKFFQADVADKIFMVSVPRRVYSSNYPEPDGEFSAADLSNLNAMGGFLDHNPIDFWKEDAFDRRVYLNDPIERAKRGVTASPSEV